MFLHFNMHLILSFASSLLQRPLAIAHCIYFNVRNRLQIDMANALLIARLILRCFLLMNSILSALRTLQFKQGIMTKSDQNQFTFPISDEADVL
jgi:hypothetical protein